jgi:hypothetical protein
MAFDLQTKTTNSLPPLAATAIWVALIATLSIGGSLAFACATPLAAIAALAAGKMERIPGLALVAAAWLSNQIVGYGILGYPQTFESFAWGAAIGVAAILAFIGARATIALANHHLLGLIMGFVAAFAAYELTLYLAGIPLSASAQTFSAPVVARIFEINIVSFAGLLLLHRVAVAISLLPSMTEQPLRTA